MKARSWIATGTLAVTVTMGALLLADVGSSSPAATPASYPTCGFYWNRNTPVSPVERRANACIVKAAREARRARIVAALTTIEGDPIVSYVFVRGARDVLVIADMTRDRYGARRWERLACTGLVVVDGRLGWKGCRSTGVGKPAWLTPVRLRR